MTTIRPSPHLNPFYIEESTDLEYSLDDDELSDDEGHYEVEGLLGKRDNGSHDSPYSSSYNRPLPMRRNKLRPTVSFSNILCFSVVFLVFMALLSLTKDSDDVDGNAQTTTSNHRYNETIITNTPSVSDIPDKTSKKTTKKKRTAGPTPTPAPATTSHKKVDKKNKDDDAPTLHFILLGERHSGVEWLRSELEACYSSAIVDFGIDRPGYWFQSSSSIPSDGTASSRAITIPIVAVRQVSTWLLAMQVEPWYAPFHSHLKWHDFVSMPWSMQRPDNDKSSGATCQYGFTYQQVIPCQWMAPQENRASHPVYEQHKNGSSFASILELRAAKLQQFTKIKGEHGIVVQFEQTLQTLLDQIEHLTGVRHTCNDREVLQQIRDDNAIDIDETILDGAEFRVYLKEHVDWEAERLAGYSSLKSR